MNSLLTNDEIYGELRDLARNFMRGERKGHTLSATDLFHEAYTRLHQHLDFDETNFDLIRSLFATTMRRVLIDHARKQTRRNRLLIRTTVSISMLECFGEIIEGENQAERLLELDVSLDKFSQLYPVHARIVELRFFGGLNFEECAAELGVCSMTVQRYWKFARAWIARDIARQES
jgi:RNA polymerase sigma factor (TIGR02999 family)